MHFFFVVVFPFHLEASCQGAQNKCFWSRWRRHTKPCWETRFPKWCLCRPYYSTARTAREPAMPHSCPAPNRTFHPWPFLIFINLAPASRDPVFFTSRPTRLSHHQALAWWSCWKGSWAWLILSYFYNYILDLKSLKVSFCRFICGVKNTGSQ